MHDPTPPPLPTQDSIRRDQSRWRAAFWLGIVLLAGPIWGILPGLFQTFGQMDGDIAQAAATITGGVARAIWGSIFGLGLVPFGILLIAFARRSLDRLKAEKRNANLAR